MQAARRPLLIVLWTIAGVLLLFVLAGALQSGRGAAERRKCTHGVSSIGPATVVNGRVVSGSTTPHTQACLP